MPYTVSLKRSAEKEVDALSPRIHDKVIKAILALKKIPTPATSKGFVAGKAPELGLAIAGYSIWLMTPVRRSRSFPSRIERTFTAISNHPCR